MPASGLIDMDLSALFSFLDDTGTNVDLWDACEDLYLENPEKILFNVQLILSAKITTNVIYYWFVLETKCFLS